MFWRSASPAVIPVHGRSTTIPRRARTLLRGVGTPLAILKRASSPLDRELAQRTVFQQTLSDGRESPTHSTEQAQYPRDSPTDPSHAIRRRSDPIFEQDSSRQRNSALSMCALGSLNADYCRARTTRRRTGVPLAYYATVEARGIAQKACICRRACRKT